MTKEMRVQLEEWLKKNKPTKVKPAQQSPIRTTWVKSDVGAKLHEMRDFK